MHGKIVIYAAAAAALAAALPVRAQTAAVERIAFADLDLTRGSDVRLARARVEAAIQRVCPAGLEHPAALPSEIIECRAQARHDARVALALKLAEARREPALFARQ